jgi:hypothetical protein
MFKCTRSACDKGHKNEFTLGPRVADNHDYVATACAKCPDKSEVQYTTKTALNKHQVEVHSIVIEEQYCPLKDACHSNLLYTTKKLLKQHLRRKHQVIAEEMKNYIPDGRKGHSNIRAGGGGPTAGSWGLTKLRRICKKMRSRIDEKYF